MSVSILPAILLFAGSPEVAQQVSSPTVVVPLAPEQPTPAAPLGPVPPVVPEAVPTSVSPATSAPQSEPSAITVTGRKPIAADPLEGVNAISFDAVQGIDKALVGPIALAYEKAVPSPVRSGLRNFLLNLHEPVVFVNYLLQLKPGRAMKTFGRFTINTTIGGAGLIDVAKNKPFNLPHRPNGFAFTLGYYGVGNGPFLFLPLIGPTTVRDMLGRVIDLVLLPAALGKPFNRPYFSTSTTVVRSLDERVKNDEKLSQIRDQAADPYVTLRNEYLKKRQADIDELRGKAAVAESPVAPATGL